MNKKEIYVGQHKFTPRLKEVDGQIAEMHGELFYKISNVDGMPPFFMNIVSSSDLWMFISSNGALTAGRRNADNALFPYYTDDRIHDSQEVTGSKTVMFIEKGGKTYLWEPFSLRYEHVYNIERNIYKNMFGNKLIFEEINHDLEIGFYYAWLNADTLGFVKKSWMVNRGVEDINVRILDGLMNILPAGVDRKFQLEYSTLADGYKKNERVADTNLALYTLTSVPTDKAEPNESLRANVVWSYVEDQKVGILLSDKQLDAFRNGDDVTNETVTKGVRGSYFITMQFTLPSGKQKEWYFVGDVNYDHCKLSHLMHMLKTDTHLKDTIEEEVSKSNEELKKILARADGLQLTHDIPNMFRHCSNTLFNVMRGGVFENNYIIEKYDFVDFLGKTYKPVLETHKKLIDTLPEQFTLAELREVASKADRDFARLCYEYLPLSFSRRHGDPSRPWNQFSIELKDENGKKRYYYQGNWRDIFQNWEALSISFPEFIENMITRFLNASTADGYNPYRVVKEGFEWEELDPHDSWSYIGYWGDHQIIYLLKLLEMSHKYHPGWLTAKLGEEFFTYANVPYRIKKYEDIVKDPQNTIDYDYELDAKIKELVREIGTNAKYVFDKNGKFYYVSLTEKLLVPLLVKLSNFIPEAGIWMNTQRPEWNDANNALVGIGASMVTLYYIRRYMTFLKELLAEVKDNSFELSEEVVELFKDIFATFSENLELLNDTLTDQQRKAILDRLGKAGSKHRMKIYENGFSGKRERIPVAEILEFLDVALKYVDHSIKAGRRDDDLYHSYNLIRFTQDGGVAVRHMSEMLEGQVAVLSSGYLPPEDVIMLLNALRKSQLYRPDQHSYILYPYKELPAFLEKNIVPMDLLKQSKLLNQMLDQDDKRIVCKDVNGQVHFNYNLRNARLLEDALNSLTDIDKTILEKERELILEIYEQVFDHKSFTGRSGSMYKYEGLGCIYWHMVSKLLLAVQENYYWALDDGASTTMLEKLKEKYYDIREGLGIHKNPRIYGAFPTDPYSHTPPESGAQQPGMTGQAKEDVLNRFGELGIRVKNGKVVFEPSLLNREEFLKKSGRFEYYNVEGKKQEMFLSEGMLGFTLCEVPVIYIQSETAKLVVTYRDGNKEEFESFELNSDISRSLFEREAKIENIQVLIPVE